MNGLIDFVLDTNMAIGCVNGTEDCLRFLNERPNAAFAVSVITRMEMLAFNGLTPEQEKVVHDFLDDTDVIPLRGNDIILGFPLSRE